MSNFLLLPTSVKHLFSQRDHRPRGSGLHALVASLGQYPANTHHVQGVGRRGFEVLPLRQAEGNF